MGCAESKTNGVREVTISSGRSSSGSCPAYTRAATTVLQSAPAVSNNPSVPSASVQQKKTDQNQKSPRSTGEKQYVYTRTSPGGSPTRSACRPADGRCSVGRTSANRSSVGRNTPRVASHHKNLKVPGLQKNGLPIECSFHPKINKTPSLSPDRNRKCAAYEHTDGGYTTVRYKKHADWVDRLSKPAYMQGVPIQG